MLFGGGSAGAGVTDVDGRVVGLPEPGFELSILKSGFHPVVDRYPFEYADYRGGSTRREVKLYPITHPGSPSLGYFAITWEDDNPLDLPSEMQPFGIDLRLEGDFGMWSMFDSVLELEADYEAFLPTEGFFFKREGPSSHAQRIIEIERGDVFYILDPGKRILRKVMLLKHCPSKYKDEPWRVESRFIYVDLEQNPEPVEPAIIPCDAGFVHERYEGESAFFDGVHVIECFLDRFQAWENVPYNGPLDIEEAMSLLEEYLRQTVQYLDPSVIKHLEKSGILF